MEWEPRQLTIFEKELVTGSEREELGLPSVKSSSCPLAVLIRAGRQGEVAQKTGERKGRERGSQELALPSLATWRATAVKPPLLILLHVAYSFQDNILPQARLARSSSSQD